MAEKVTTAKPSPSRGGITNGRVLAIVGVLLVILIAGGLYLAMQPGGLLGEKLYGKVGSRKITTAEVKRLAAAAPPYTEKQVGETLMQEALYEQMGQANGITIKDIDVKSALAIETRSSVPPQGEEYLLIALKRTLLEKRLKELVTGSARGRFIVGHFDQFIKVEGGSFTAEEQKRTPKQWQDLVDAGKSYAGTLLTNLRNQVVSGKIAFNQAQQAESDDPKIGQKALPTTFHSGNFDTNDSSLPATIFYSQDGFKNALANASLGVPSELFLGKVDSTIAGNGPETDGYWLIIQVDNKVDKLKDYSNLDDMVKAYKVKLHYATYSK